MVYNQPLPQSVPVMQNSRSQFALSQDEQGTGYPYLEQGNAGDGYQRNPYAGVNQVQPAPNPYPATNTVTINRSAVNPYGAS